MGGLFGKSESSASIPGFVEDAAKEMLAQSVAMGKTGYMPWSGPDVAALTPDQLAARENTNSAASAFGLNVGGLGTPGATDFGNGIWGHSSLPMYDQQMQYMQANRPGQLEYYNGFFVDPVTGAPSQYDQAQAQQAAAPQTGPYNHPSTWDGAYIERGREGYSMPTSTGPSYTGLADMFNGGGPGASGPTYQGGGLLSDIGNRRNERKGRKANSGGLFGGLF